MGSICSIYLKYPIYLICLYHLSHPSSIHPSIQSGSQQESFAGSSARPLTPGRAPRPLSCSDQLSCWKSAWGGAGGRSHVGGCDQWEAQTARVGRRRSLAAEVVSRAGNGAYCWFPASEWSEREGGGAPGIYRLAPPMTL